MSIDTIVIGAGWSGLTAARVMVGAGRKVVVLEKSRGPGGRSAMRRCAGARFDHGAQYFTARSAAFGRQLQQWRDAGLVQPWRPRLAVIGDKSAHSDPEEVSRFVAVPGMNAVCRQFAAELDCRFEQRVSALNFDREWCLELESGERLQARRRCGDQQPAGLQSLARLEFQAPLAIEIEGRHPLLEATVQLCGKLAADRIHARYCNESRHFFRVAVSRLVADDREPGPPGLNQPGIAPLLQLPTECRAARGEVLGTVIEAGAGASAHRTSAARPSGFLEHDDLSPGADHDARCGEAGPAGADNNRIYTHLSVLARTVDVRRIETLSVGLGQQVADPRFRQNGISRKNPEIFARRGADHCRMIVI